MRPRPDAVLRCRLAPSSRVRRRGRGRSGRRRNVDRRSPRGPRRYRMRRPLRGGTRCVPQPVVDARGHRAEMALTGEHLSERVRDVHDLDIRGVDLGRRERGIHDLRGQRGKIASFLGQIAREVALVTAENPHVGAAHEPAVLQLKELLDGIRHPEGGPASSRSEPTRPWRARWSTVWPPITGHAHCD